LVFVFGISPSAKSRSGLQPLVVFNESAKYQSFYRQNRFNTAISAMAAKSLAKHLSAESRCELTFWYCTCNT